MHMDYSHYVGSLAGARLAYASVMFFLFRLMGQSQLYNSCILASELAVTCRFLPFGPNHGTISCLLVTITTQSRLRSTRT